MRAIGGLVLSFVLVFACAACGDDDAPADAGTPDAVASDVGPMCIDPGQSCSFTPCCEGFCCCVSVGDAASCAFTCVAERMGTCR